jgi:hypothetical protein
MNDSNEKSEKPQSASPINQKSDQRVYTSYKGVHRPSAPDNLEKNKENRNAMHDDFISSCSVSQNSTSVS